MSLRAALAGLAEPVQRAGAVRVLHRRTGPARFVLAKLGDPIGVLGELAGAVQVASMAWWSAENVIAYAARQLGPCTLIASTYHLERGSCAPLVRLLADGDLLAAEVLLDPKHRAMAHQAVDQLEAAGRVLVRVTHTHAKVYVLQGLDRSITIESSSNPLGPAMIENYLIDDDDDLAAFHVSWIRERLDRAEAFRVVS